MIKAIEVNDGIVVIQGKVPVKVPSSDFRFQAVRDAVYANDVQALDQALSSTEIETVFRNVEFKGMGATADGVSLYGKPLHGALVDKIVSLIREGHSVEKFVRFYSNLMNNPSKKAVEELYDFMLVKELPITEDGRLVAYKGVNPDGYSITGNTDTIVLQGKVDKGGRILNEVGSVVEVLRSSVDDDREVGCSTGLHVGSWAYASGFGELILTVAVNPRNVVSVPSHDHSKMRVCKYEVLDTTVNEIERAVYNTDDENSLLDRESGIEEGLTLRDFLVDMLTNDMIVYLDDTIMEFGIEDDDERLLIQQLVREGYRVLREGRIVFDD